MANATVKTKLEAMAIKSVMATIVETGFGNDFYTFWNRYFG